MRFEKPSKKSASSSSGVLPDFTEEKFVFVARKELHAGEKLCLRWRGPRRIVKALNNYVYSVEDLRNGSVDDIHISRFKVYSDSSLDTEIIMSHVLKFETGMVVQHLMGLAESDDGLLVQVCWREFSASEDTCEPHGQVYKNVTHLLLERLCLKNVPGVLEEQARRVLLL